MKVIITGASGEVGRNLSEYLIRKKYTVVALDHKQCDITEKGAVVKIIKKEKPDVVINCAAYGGYYDQVDKKNIFLVNYIGAKNLLLTCIAGKVPLFVQCGTSVEYGFKNRPMKENMRTLNPKSDYAKSKLLATKCCMKLAKKETKVIVLRLFGVYGYYERHDRLIPQIILNALSGGTIHMSNPSYVRDFIFVEDVCRAFEVVIKKRNILKSGTIFNVGSGREQSLADVIRTYKRINPYIKVSWNNNLQRGIRDRTKHWQSDISKMRAELGWKPMNTLEQGLRKTTNWFEGRYNGRKGKFRTD